MLGTSDNPCQALATATDLRQKEDAKNVATISDAEQAQTAVAQARRFFLHMP